MAHLAVFSSLLLAVLVLALIPSSYAGPACARRNSGSGKCSSRCKGRWGYPGRVMGTDSWGQVMTVTMTNMDSVVTKACRVRPTPSLEPSASTSAISVATPVANVGGAIPVFESQSQSESKSASSPGSSPTVNTAASLLSLASSPPAKTSAQEPAHTSASVEANLAPQNKPAPAPTQQELSPEPAVQQEHPSENTSHTTTPAAPKPAVTLVSKPQAPPSATTPASKPASQPQPPASDQGSTPQSDISQYLSAHNTIRAQHGAAPLTWSDELASKAQEWANKCVFQHSGGTLGPFGENLAAGTGSSYDIAAAVKSWTDEVSQYDPSNPVPSHFTQVVWKASTQVGCAVQSCNGIFAASFGPAKFFVCEYSPQGNVIGEFGQNVQV